MATTRYKAGETLRYSWKGASHDCTIIERRSKGKQNEYYIHFIGLDRRLDRWVSHEQLQEIEKDEKNGVVAGATPATPHNQPPTTTRRASRRDKRKFGTIINESGGAALDAENEALEKEHEERTKVKNVDRVQLGKYEVDTWYFSPYPESYRDLRKLYVCEFCLKYMRGRKTLMYHQRECKLRHPPGNEIYRDGNISVFEVDGANQKIYCQCLCLLAKLFIDHKTLYFDVSPFLFYILCESDAMGCHIVGFFSKEKHSPENHNVACILTFPQFQRKGFGRFLIAFSYELSKIENKHGSPEKPLSDLGKVSYRSYWTKVLLETLTEGSNWAVKDISALTCIKPEDVISTMDYLGLIRWVKGQHVIAVTPKLLEQHRNKLSSKKKPRKGITILDPSKISWTPPVFPPPQKKTQKHKR